MLWKSNCCVEVVKDVWRGSFFENKATLKKSLNMPEGKSLFKKRMKSQIKLELPEPTKFMLYYLQKSLKLYAS